MDVRIKKKETRKAGSAPDKRQGKERKMKKDEKVEYIKAAKPCPECGGKDHIRMMRMGAAWAVTCDDCGYTVGPFSLIRSAVKRWADDSKAAEERRAKEEEERRAKEEEERKQKERETKTLAVTIFDLPVERLMNHPRNVRKTYTEIDDLAESIKSRGIMQNLTVVPAPGHKESADLFYVVIGNRRLQAAKKAGLKSLPCSIAWDMSEREQFSIMVTENMQRSDLTIEEQAESFQLMLDLGETVETIKEKTGLSESTVRHRLKLAELGVENIKKRRLKDGTDIAGTHYYQLTIGDYAYLEKIKDVERRRVILEGAKDSSNLRWAVDSELMAAAKKECEAAARERFKQLGIKEKDGYYNYQDKMIKTFSGWNEETLEEIRKWEPPKKTPVKELYWSSSYSNIVVRHKAKEVKEETPADRERKRLEKNRKQLNELAKALTAEVRTFAAEVARGKYGKPENEAVFVHSGLIAILTEDYGRFSVGPLASVYTNYKDVYGHGLDPKYKQEIATLDTWKIILLGIVSVYQDNIAYIVSYPCDYTTRNADKAMNIIKILEKFGYEPSNPQYKDYLNGTHELFNKILPGMPKPETGGGNGD